MNGPRPLERAFNLLRSGIWRTFYRSPGFKICECCVDCVRIADELKHAGRLIQDEIRCKWAAWPDLNGRASALYATAFGRYLLDNGMARPGDAILIGRDFRDTNSEIAANCADALAEDEAAAVALLQAGLERIRWWANAN